ncbi:NAD-dependent protein deacetylase [Companilactobacillus versmoldensis]|uniref:NAD-dependent protein deacetylase, SIR2 family n=1 Tax=Companilactobacillus versmoldensis DSM 14857 = KCTC 3814 TaxID=1423815 RepID=A0A0R1SCI3_9LACO|nr:NAD-dependent protein deacetylase [Companilactobacillus versmoldensis]KRL66871.1 NAD-dependent protein deacetylase, SIR2 family [Companilactobacillus versmoldensis DSM 14857 = KCTC 3814]
MEQLGQTMYEKLVMQTQLNYQNYFGAYAQGGTPVALTNKKPLPYDEQIKILAEKIEEADHIIIGGASGLSAAGGGDFYYENNDTFKKYFGKFEQKYDLNGAFSGMTYPWKTREEYWGYLATFLNTTLHAEVRKPFKDLQAILQGKDYFILTTNQDTQAIKAFPEDKVAEIQGDHRFFQCSNQCTDQVWDAVKPVEEMVEAMGDDTRIPTDMIPKCPNCGAEAFPWTRGYGNFLEGTKYQQEYQKISDDVVAHMHDDHLLFIELGVGRMTPMFIQEPFWALTTSLDNTYDVMVNRDYQFLPKQIEDKGQAIKADIDQVLDDVRAQLNR